MVCLSAAAFRGHQYCWPSDLDPVTLTSDALSMGIVLHKHIFQHLYHSRYMLQFSRHCTLRWHQDYWPVTLTQWPHILILKSFIDMSCCSSVSLDWFYSFHDFSLRWHQNCWPMTLKLWLQMLGMGLDIFINQSCGICFPVDRLCWVCSFLD